MTTQLASLEAALEQLALEFAEKLLATAISAPISELSVVLRAGKGLHRGILRAVATHVKAERQPVLPSRVTRAPRPRALAVRSHAVAREALAPAPHSRTPFDEADEADEVDDSDAFANAITDPSLLLEVIGSGRPAARHPRPETQILVTKAPASEQGPTLRPGESLQRTAGGGVVLRRGAR
jgi:hypothetical protein